VREARRSGELSDALGGTFGTVATAAGASATLVGLASGVTYLFLERRAARRHQNRTRALGDDACPEPSEDQAALCESARRALADRRHARRQAELWLGAAAAGAAVTWTAHWLGSKVSVTTSATLLPKGATLTLRGSL
jgi:hypothetical protein